MQNRSGWVARHAPWTGLRTCGRPQNLHSRNRYSVALRIDKQLSRYEISDRCGGAATSESILRTRRRGCIETNWMTAADKLQRPCSNDEFQPHSLLGTRE